MLLTGVDIFFQLGVCDARFYSERAFSFLLQECTARESRCTAIRKEPS